MRCSNCGKEIPVGSLYCEQCGEDIHIVPDFVPEVEFNIEQTINGIAEDIKDQQAITEKEAKDLPLKTGRKKLSLAKRIGLLVLFVMIVVIGITGVVTTYRYNSFEVQTQMAKQCVEKEEYDKAIQYYKRALEINEEDIPTMFKLAEVYFLKNNKIEYEYLLRQIVQNNNASAEQIESAYGKLIAIYRAREDYKSINELLVASNDEKVMYTYQNYVAMVPEFSIQEGFYTDIQPLKLTAYGTGKIYYTMDGSEPDENSEQYIAPIILDDGDYTIKAYFVNEFGIASECVTKTYHVEIEKLPAPFVITLSGDYYAPNYIEIMDDDQEVYYTTDGSTPTENSAIYTGPIHMPLGKTTFKFMRIEGGRTSEVVERTYNLEIETECTPEKAEEDVVAYSIESGKIINVDGLSLDGMYTYLYDYQYVIEIKDVGYFYVISETAQDLDGTQTKTGNHFAVNIYGTEIYKLQINENNNYTLVEIEGQSFK